MGCELDIAADIERFACAYERAVYAGNARVEDYLPSPDHSGYAEIIVELLRIDLELAWQRRHPVPLDVYQRRFADVLDTPERLEPLAFEEYRQRFQAGEEVDPSTYSNRYGINVASWTLGRSSVAVVQGTKLAWPEAIDSTDARADPARLAALDLDASGLAAGQDFPAFELVEELGRGAFARVFLARQRDLANRPVALKISRGFSIEPDRLAQLQHANIVPIYSVHRSGELQAVCMPYVGRSTLAHVIGQSKRSGRLPQSGRDLLSTIVAANDGTIALPGGHRTPSHTTAPTPPLARSIREHVESASYVDAVVWIIGRLADGLAHAHERGILHRDLKPANVLFSDDGRPMILDFNLSDQVGGSKAAVGGTLPYMAPEHLKSLLTGASLGESSDIYSLGVMLYELLSGQLPYQPPVDGTPEAIAAAISARCDPAPSVRLLNPETPPSIAAVVARCLAPDSEKRYRAASELREDLDRHLANLPLVYAPDRSPRERIRKWARRHPRVSSAAAIGSLCSIAIAAVAAGWLLREDHFGHVDARSRFQDFAQQIHEARLPLSIPRADADAHAEGSAYGRRLLDSYGILEDRDWRESAAYVNLKPAEREELDAQLVRLLHALASSSLRQAAAKQNAPERPALLGEALAYNAAAIEAAGLSDKSAVLSLRRQLSLIQRVQVGKNPPTASELIDDAAGVTGPELATLQLLLQGQFGEALPRLIQWRDEQPTSLSAWMLLGVANAGIGNPVEAEECFTTCTRLRPSYPSSYFQRGLARHQQKKYGAAVEDFSHYIELNGRRPAALINRALAYQALDENQRAILDLNAALAAGAQQTRVYFIRAAVRHKLNDVAGSREDVRTGLALTPTDSTSWIARGMARLEHSPELALDDFRQALIADPSSRVAAQNALHVLLDRLDGDKEALTLLEKLIASNPQDARALNSRAVLLARRGDALGAEADAAAALTIDDAPLAYLQAACAFSQLSTADDKYRTKALQLLATAVGKQPALAPLAMKDPDLEPIRDSDEFEHIIAAANVIAASASPDPHEAVAKQ